MDRLMIDSYECHNAARLVLMSTVLLSALDVVRSQLCGEDAFFDAVVGDCTLCSDVCSPLPQTHTYCRNNCRDYYDRMMAQLARNPVTSPTTRPTVTSSPLLTVLQTHPNTFQSRHWSDGSFSPFGWIIACVALATMVTVVTAMTLVLCVVKRRDAIRYGSVVDNEVGSNSRSTSCKCEDTSIAWSKASDKSLLVASPSDSMQTSQFERFQQSLK
jgi:hypothetical protein